MKLQRCFSATKIRQKRIFPTPLTVRTATIEFQRRKSAVGWRTRVVAVHQEALTHSVDIPVDIFDVALCSITRPRDHRMCTPVFVSLPLPHSVSLSLSLSHAILIPFCPMSRISRFRVECRVLEDDD